MYFHAFKHCKKKPFSIKTKKVLTKTVGKIWLYGNSNIVFTEIPHFWVFWELKFDYWELNSYYFSCILFVILFTELSGIIEAFVKL